MVNWTEKIGNRVWSKDFKAGFVTKGTVTEDDEYRPCGSWRVDEFSAEAVGEQIGTTTQADVITALEL